jgi:hypothetical protein
MPRLRPASQQGPAAFSILAPRTDHPEALSVTGICPACANRSDDDLVALALAAIKRDVFHDVRSLHPVHMQTVAGRA